MQINPKIPKFGNSVGTCKKTCHIAACHVGITLCSMVVLQYWGM